MMDGLSQDDAERLRRIAAILDLMPVSEPRDDQERRRIVRTIAGYLVPSVDRMEAPLLVAVSGGDGAGKSHVVNAVFDSDVAPEGAVRPTTKVPALVGAVDGDGSPVTSVLRRVQASAPEVEVVPVVGSLGEKIGLVDLPGSVDEVAGRKVRNVADLVILVVTPSRYADATIWTMLESLRSRSIPVWLVLNRLRRGDDEVLVDLKHRLQTVDSSVRLFTVPERRPGEGSADRAAGLVRALQEIAGARKAEFLGPSLRRRTEQVVNRTAALTFPLDDVRRSGEQLLAVVEEEYGREAEGVRTLVTENGLGSGAAASAWADVAERLAGVVTHRVGVAAERTAARWQKSPEGTALLAGGGSDLWRHPPDTARIAKDRLVDWERQLGGVVAGHTRRSLNAAKLGQVVEAVRTRSLGDTSRPRWRIRRRLREDIDVPAGAARELLADIAADVVLDDRQRFVRRLGDRPSVEALEEVRSLLAVIGSPATSADAPGDRPGTIDREPVAGITGEDADDA